MNVFARHMVSWTVAPCSLVELITIRKDLLSPKKKKKNCSSMLRKVCNSVPDYTVSSEKTVVFIYTAIKDLS
jgi:hypothetical protein